MEGKYEMSDDTEQIKKLKGILEVFDDKREMYTLQTFEKLVDEIAEEVWDVDVWKQKKEELKSIREIIKESIKHQSQLGGRSTLNIQVRDKEKIIYIITGEHQNSKCPECGNPVSCVCTSECNHIWYCPDHVLDHKHRQEIEENC